MTVVTLTNGAAVEVSDLDRGHAAHLLSNVWHEKKETRRNSRYTWTHREKTTRRFTNEEVAALLQIPLDEMLRVRDLYQAKINPWPEHRIRNAIIAFLKKEKRWPGGDDFRPPRKRLENGLPSAATWQRSGGQSILFETFRDPKKVKGFAPAVILGIQNATVRTEAVTAYGGYERIIRKGGGSLRQQDDFGKLWELPPEPDITEDVALFVEVVNATENDGKRERFYLRVPPMMSTAKEAVEWSFGIPLGQLEEFAAAT